MRSAQSVAIPPIGSVPTPGVWARRPTPWIQRMYRQPSLGALDLTSTLTSINPTYLWVAGLGAVALLAWMLRPKGDELARKIKVRRSRSKRYSLARVILYSAGAGVAGYLYGQYKGSQGTAL